jgi:hypothetical protein
MYPLCGVDPVKILMNKMLIFDNYAYTRIKPDNIYIGLLFAIL